MRPQVRAHTLFQHGHAARRSQAAAVDDADAAVAAVAGGVEVLLHAGAGSGGGHAVEVAAVRRDILPAFQFSDLAPVHSVRGEVFI